MQQAENDLSSTKDFAPGISYVALSRVKSIKGILLEKEFPKGRFGMTNTANIIARAVDRVERRKQIIPLASNQIS